MSLENFGQTRFVDRMRVSKEHLEHLQDVLAQAAFQLRIAIGTGKVVYGLKTRIQDGSKIVVEPGYALDKMARPLSMEREQVADVPAVAHGSLKVVIAHQLRTDSVINGRATILKDEAVLSLRPEEPPYEDGGVRFAEIHFDDGTLRVVQKGAWYLPPLDHGHSGGFLYDENMRWRFDGYNTGMGEPLFDSGFVPLSPGGQATFKHGLNSSNLLVQCRSKDSEDVITCSGFGTEFWYELPDTNKIRLVRTDKSESGERSYQAVVWKYGAAKAGPVLPVADAGANREEEIGNSFNLDGSLSRAFGGRDIIKYLWTQIK